MKLRDISRLSKYFTISPCFLCVCYEMLRCCCVLNRVQCIDMVRVRNVCQRFPFEEISCTTHKKPCSSNTIDHNRRRWENNELSQRIKWEPRVSFQCMNSHNWLDGIAQYYRNIYMIIPLSYLLMVWQPKNDTHVSHECRSSLQRNTHSRIRHDLEFVCVLLQFRMHKITDTWTRGKCD